MSDLHCFDDLLGSRGRLRLMTNSCRRFTRIFMRARDRKARFVEAVGSLRYEGPEFRALGRRNRLDIETRTDQIVQGTGESSEESYSA